MDTYCLYLKCCNSEKEITITTKPTGEHQPQTIIWKRLDKKGEIYWACTKLNINEVYTNTKRYIENQQQYSFDFISKVVYRCNFEDIFKNECYEIQEIAA